MADLITGIDFLAQRLTPKGLTIPKNYYTSGFVAVLAAFLKKNNITSNQFSCHHDSNAGYFKAIGLSKAVWGVDDYTMRRQNAGKNYAPLTHLDSKDAIDSATSQINSCLRAFSKSTGYGESAAFVELLAVVGELHDNVWSHGLNSGFSTAQRRECPEKGWVIEFALADCGMGFLDELRRARISNVNTDTDAIKWCIEEGNSSKKPPIEDPWSQALPDDFVGDSPYGNQINTFVNTGNHHQGLGLAKLLSLAKNYGGTLYLASGFGYLKMSNGITSFGSLKNPWGGVAVSLTLSESRLIPSEVTDSQDGLSGLADLMKTLRG